MVKITLADAQGEYGTAFVSPEVWDKIQPRQEDFVFYVSEYGRFHMRLDWWA